MTEKATNKVTFLGIRGSMPAMGPLFSCYGSDTSAYEVSLGGTTIFVDCGTGIHNAAADMQDLNDIHLFITHGHLDHIAGIFELLPILKGKTLHLYGSTYNGRNVLDQMNEYAGPPLWPVSLEQMTKVEVHELNGEPVVIGDVKVSTMRSNHPGGCTIYRFDGQEKSVVIASDFNHEDGAGEALVEFARDCDLLVYDGSMDEEEYKIHSDWGHSTPEMGIEIAERCGAKELAITHHNSAATDEKLDRWEHQLRAQYDRVFFAYEGLRVDVNGALPDYCYTEGIYRSDDRLNMLIDICTDLTAEVDRDKLWEKIIRAAMRVTNSDGGTIYIATPDTLIFKVMITKSKGYFKGGKGDPIDLPAVPLTMKNVSTAAALTHEVINIPDVYNSTKYDFNGPKRYDALTGYQTRSMMVVPMEDANGKLVGVMQLLNSMDENGTVIPFDEKDEQMVRAIASQAAIALSNHDFTRQLTTLLNGFVRSVSTGIDARTPYNANHTKNMVNYCAAFLKHQGEIGGPYRTSGTFERQELIMSIWLHDVGKLATPLEIMDKAHRLTDLQEAAINHRYEKRRLLLRLQFAEKKITAEEYLREQEEIAAEQEFILKVNLGGFLPDEDLDRLLKIGTKTFTDVDGSVVPCLTDEEMHELCIRRGTLTAEERQIMQEHVSVTASMLEKLTFPAGFSHVYKWASNHHEFLNGTGYPNRLTAEELDWQSRLITVLDIFEALTAEDRPYRRSMSVDRALIILREMVDEGKLDGDLVEAFANSNAWEEEMRRRARQPKLD